MEILTTIFLVFSGIGEWIVTTIPKMLNLFWNATAGDGSGGLTPFGILSVALLSITVVFLLIRFILNFLHSRD